MKKSILMKTFLNLLAVMMVLVVITHISIFYIYKNFYVNNCTEQIDKNIKYVTEVLKTADNRDAVLQSYVKNNNVNICLKIGSQKKYYHNEQFYLDFYNGKDTMHSIKGVDGAEAILLRTRDVLLANGKRAKVQLSMNLKHLRESKAIALSLLPYSLFISLLVSLMFSYFYSKRITNPILSMSSVLKSMNSLDEKARIDIKNGDELGTLAEDINDLYLNFRKIISDYEVKNEEVLHLESERLDFFRGASHELKTPLAKLSIITENMRYNVGKYRNRDKYLSEALAVIDELSEMISVILNGVKNLNVEVDAVEEIQIRGLIEKIVDDYRIIAKSKHMSLKTNLEGNMTLPILPSDMDKVLSNIVSNAIKHGIDGKVIRITMSDCQLSIYNEAEEISAEVMENIWKGHYVLSSSRDAKSSGMGLYIIKSILDRYAISYEFSPYECGYVFRITK